MEQMYLIEIFINKVTVFAKDDEEGTKNKNLIIKINFGPKVQFIVKEGQLAVVDRPDDIIETDEKTGRRQWMRTIRTGKSYLFPSHPDTILQTLSKFPLEVEVWNDDDTELENNTYIGVGSMFWDRKFFFMLRETRDSCKIHEPLSIKSKVPLMAECCCNQVGEIDFILRLSALGDSIITEFQQLMKDPESFVFRTNKAPSMFECKRIEGDDPNFCMVGSLYETTTLEDPEIVDRAQNKIEVCTELQSCGMVNKPDQYVCDHTATESPTPKKYAIDKIRMGDIRGPCGNTNCVLAHKVRKYIRALDSYKGKASGITDTKPQDDRKVCGKCVCKDDRWHRDSCPATEQTKVRCIGCEGMTEAGNTCKEKRDKHFATGVTPKTSDTQINYVFSTTKFQGNKKSLFRQDTIVENCFCAKFNNSVGEDNKARQDLYPSSNDDGCSCRQSETIKTLESKTTMYSVGTNNPMIYNAESNAPRYTTRMSTAVSSGVGTNYVMTYNVGTSVGNTDPKRKMQVFNCEVADDKECKCNPKKPGPPCKTFDCDCLSETENIIARKLHRPYCPSYKHKDNCPVTMMHEEEEQKKNEEDEEEVAPLPYGLPPIQLGPCPILGRPCTVPDGFARMYKNAQLPTQPYSYSEEGKVCCSKEYERIKKAIKEYMKYEKGHDYRCINKFDVDTERRCCDKEQVLLSLMGKACCGSHKMAIQDKFGEEKMQEKEGEKDNEKDKKKKRKNASSKYNYSFGDMYPGVCIGHKHCLLSRPTALQVPPTMGWLWNATDVPGMKSVRRGWSPGAIGKSVAKTMTFKFARGGPDKDKNKKNKKKKKGSRPGGADVGGGDSEPEEALEPKPTLKVQRKGDVFTIQVSPLKDLTDILPNEDPYVDCDPMVFKIIKKRSPEEQAKVEARKMVKLKKQRDAEIRKALAEAVEDICKCAYMDVYCNDLSAIDRVIDTCPAFKEPECICKEESLSSLSSNATWDIEYTPPFGCFDLAPRKRKTYIHVETQYIPADAGIVEPPPKPKCKRSCTSIRPRKRISKRSCCGPCAC